MTTPETRCECGKARKDHRDVLGTLYCHPFTRDTTGEEAMAVFRPAPPNTRAAAGAMTDERLAEVRRYYRIHREARADELLAEVTRLRSSPVADTALREAAERVLSRFDAGLLVVPDEGPDEKLVPDDTVRAVAADIRSLRAALSRVPSTNGGF